MTLRTAALAVALIAGLVPTAGASAVGDDFRTYSYKTLLEDPAFVAQLPRGVKYYFGDQPAVVKSEIGPISTRRMRPRPARKTPVSAACLKAAGDALITMGLDAQVRGGNAVVGIKSTFKDRVNASADQFDCGFGLQMLSVNLVGTVAVVE